MLHRRQGSPGPHGRPRGDHEGRRLLHRPVRDQGPLSGRRPTGGNRMTDQTDPLLATLSGEALRDLAAAELLAARDRTTLLTSAVHDADLVKQHSPLMSPLVWDLAHVANQEELWLLRAVGGRDAMRPEIDPLSDAFEHPRAERPTLPLLTPAEARRYGPEVRGRVLDLIEKVKLPPGAPGDFGTGPTVSGTAGAGFALAMVAQHAVHPDETM